MNKTTEEYILAGMLSELNGEQKALYGECMKEMKELSDKYGEFVFTLAVVSVAVELEKKKA